jgi:endo-1,4-beta-mannosidase
MERRSRTMSEPRKWQEVHGANYLPSYARNAEETWEKFDPERVDRELGYAQSLGLNSVRVWLDSRPYERNPALMLRRLEHFLDLCAQHDLTAMLVLFDACGVEPDVLKEKGESFDPHWRRWTANPGYDYLTQEHWDRLERYVKDIVTAHLEDPRVLAWDVMNEPWVGGRAENEEQRIRIQAFVQHFCTLVRNLCPATSITVGVVFLDRAEWVEDLVDVISFHCYQPNPAKWKPILERAHRYAQLKRKPILLTEWGYPTYKTEVASGRVITDEEQLRYYEKVLPLLMEANIGWYLFDLIMGYGPFARLSILKPNGDPRPAAAVVAKYLRSQ